MDIATWSPVLGPLALASLAVICLTGVFLWKTRAEDKPNPDGDTTSLDAVTSIMSARH